MTRSCITSLKEDNEYDIVVIGGGATGLGCAVDAASRGYKTLLLEKGDFACATSSRSTKLIHGGLRYLQQGNVGLVFEALHERGRLAANAPHLFIERPFLVPNYKWWEGPFYGIGLKIYDLLAGRLGLEASRHITKKETLETLPTIHEEELRGATLYYDGQFDDARLALTLALTAQDQGATVINYAEVTHFMKDGKRICGVGWKDTLHGESGEIHAKVVINATGIFSDEICHLDDPTAPNHIAPSQGVHLVLPSEFLPGDTALLIPKTKDGRVIFVVPWHDRIIVGTTDTPKEHPEKEPTASDEEIDFILEQAGAYLSIAPSRDDILSIFTGLRPLVSMKPEAASKKIARDHKIFTSESGLVTIAGGKWTTYRKMALDTIDKAAAIAKLPHIPSPTEMLSLHGYLEKVNPEDTLSVYGSNIGILTEIIEENPQFQERLSQTLPYRFAEVVYACRHEMAHTLEDVLSRRTRALLLNAKEAVESAPAVASVMATELQKDEAWIKNEIDTFTTLARKYLPS